MKRIACSFFLMMASLIAQAQVITVTATTLQKFNHASNISTVEAMKQDAIEYPSYIVGNNIYVFDLNNRTMTLNGGVSCSIAEVNIDENIMDCIVMDNGVPVLYLIGETAIGQIQFLTEWTVTDKIYGLFSMNSDFSYTVE